MDRVLKSINTAKTSNAECHQTCNEQQQTWQTTVHDVAVKIAGTFVGQAMMMQFDKLLWTLEKTATWIPDGKTDGKRGKAPASLVRPLPWLFFLPILVFLRYTRVILSFISLCCGFDGIKASTMVSFLHQSRRNIRQITLEAKQNSKHRNSSIESVQMAILSLLSNLSNLVGQTSERMNVHNNKTSLNTSGEKATMQHDMLRNPIPDEESDSEDSEDQDYLDFVSRTLPEASDSDDADYAFELNDDETSDTDSQSSVATNEFSDDDEKQPHPSVEVVVNSEMPKHVSPPDNDCNHSASANTTADQREKGDTVLHDLEDAQSSACNEVDDVLNRLIDDTNAATEANTIPRAKPTNRHHKNGRFHPKPHNNGKHFNGAHALAKSKAVKSQNIQSTSEFIAEEFITEAVAADRT